MYKENLRLQNKSSTRYYSKIGFVIAVNFYYIFWYILMSLCCVESLRGFRLQLWPFKKTPKLKKIPCAIAHGFCQKWLQNHPKFLLHLLIHIDVLMLCSKFELIPTSIFQVTAILRKHQKSAKAISKVFSKKWLQNHPKLLLHFLIHIDVLRLRSKFELIPTSIFQVTTILRKHQKSDKYLRL